MAPKLLPRRIIAPTPGAILSLLTAYHWVNGRTSFEMNSHEGEP